MKSKCRDVNALTTDPDHDPRRKHFISSQGSRRKHLEISFDPDKHKEWVTGFRKRKNERKTAGLKQLEEKAKQEKFEARTKRKKQRKEELQLPDDYGVHDSDVESQDGKHVVTDQAVYAVQGQTTTVTVEALALDPGDSECEASDSSSDDEQHGEASNGRKVSKFAAFPTATERYPEEQKDGLVHHSKEAAPRAELKADDRSKKGKKSSANQLAALQAKRNGVSKRTARSAPKAKVGKSLKGRSSKKK